MSIDTSTGQEAPADFSSARVKTIFSTIAQKYERFNVISSFGACIRWKRALVRTAPITSNDNVLDIAGGTGSISFALARAKHPRHIQCTDLVGEMLSVARERYARGASKGTPINFEVMDAQALAYADNVYDVVTMAYGIRNFPERKRALQEINRVLKPGGYLVCLEFSTPPNRLWRTLYQIYLTYCIPFWGKLITGNRENFIYLSQSIQAFPSQCDLANMMSRSGFINVTWKNYTGGIACIHLAQKPACTTS